MKRICAPQAKRENKCQNEQVSVISTELIGYQIPVLQQNNCTVFIMKVQAPKLYIIRPFGYFDWSQFYFSVNFEWQIIRNEHCVK